MSRAAPFTVHLEVFDGPLDLLLTLIRRQCLDITTVALAQVTGQYLTYLANLEEIDSGALASFCEVASTLLLIKSRALLPASGPSVSEAEEDVDAMELVERLRAYRQLHRVAEELGRRERAGLRVYTRVAGPPELAPALPPGEVPVDVLVSAFEAALAQVGPPAEAPGDPSLQPHAVQLADRLVQLRQLILERGRITFLQALGDGRGDREFIIVSFLAVLELLRLRWLRAIQDELFGEIALELHPEAAVAAASSPADGVPLATLGQVPPRRVTETGASEPTGGG